MELIKDTIVRYKKIYGSDPAVIVMAPARINLIGEHTDYNQGYVLPVAIDRTIIIAAGNRRDKMLFLHTVDLQASISTSLSHLEYDSAALWSNYPKGVAFILQRLGYHLHGANFCIRGNIPIGAGLSSSAALEVASTIAFNYLNDFKIPLIELIKISQAAETDFVGVQCGIMDQFISLIGKSNHALFLDCRSLDYRYIPCPDKVRLVVCDTGVRRELTRSAYNQRQLECEEAVSELRKGYPLIKSLRDISLDQLKEAEQQLTPISMKRALHVVSENDRVLESVKALENRDYNKLGRLMVESHDSLRDNYEVCNRELNLCVDITLGTEGVYGARMTGAGFGGSVVCLVTEDAIDLLVDRLRSDYPRQVGHSLTIYLASSGDGASIINPKVSMIPTSVAQL